VDEAEAERELTLMIGRLEEFAARVRDGLNDLDWAGKQALIRTLVRRVEINRNHVEIIFRVPPPAPETSRPLEPPSDRETWHHCTDDQHLHCGTPGPLGGVHTIKAIHLS
jgi:site-specific DNA recombinase